MIGKVIRELFEESDIKEAKQIFTGPEYVYQVIPTRRRQLALVVVMAMIPCLICYLRF